MKLRKILMYLLCLLMCFCTMQPSCCAMSINEKYGFYFKEASSGNVIVQKTKEDDIQVLKNLILGEGKEFARYLGNGFESANPDELLVLDGGLSITVKDSHEKVAGQITLTDGSNPNQLNVGYWIGKDFRGNGYAHVAVCKVISKIWEINKNVAFEFWIDDENISSIKTLEKVCNFLDIALEKRETHIVEWTAEKNNHIQSTYNVNFYYDGVLNFSGQVTKEKLLETFSEEIIDKGILVKSQTTIYLLKR